MVRFGLKSHAGSRSRTRLNTNERNGKDAHSRSSKQSTLGGNEALHLTRSILVEGGREAEVVLCISHFPWSSHDFAYLCRLLLFRLAGMNAKQSGSIFRMETERTEAR